MFECPIEYFDENLIFAADRSCWALYELQGFDYDLLSGDSKIRRFHQLTLFIANIESEAKLMILPASQDLKAHFTALKEGLVKDDPLYSDAVLQADRTYEYLQQITEENGRSNDYRIFVSFKLEKSGDLGIASSFREAADFLTRSVTNGFQTFLQADTRDISKSRISGYKKLSEEIYRDQSRRIALLPVPTETTQWLIRRPMFRGLPRDFHLYIKSQTEAWKPYAAEVSLAGKQYLRPRRRELVNLFSGVIKKDGRRLKIEHDGETSYQSFLTITNIPEEQSFPGCEWIYFLQRLNQQAEACIHIRCFPHREAVKKIEDQGQKVTSLIENVQKSEKHQVPDDLWVSQAEVESLIDELKESKLPLINASVTICLADSDPNILERKVAAVRREYEDLNFIVERPLTDQFALFMHTLPVVSFPVPDFIMKLTPMALASGMIGATHQLGDATGAYAGTTGTERKHVFADLRQAPRSNRSASAAFYGDLGFGKSFNANLLLYLHIMNGAYGLIIDPKGERSHWQTDLTALQGHISTVTLAAQPQFRGKLDPFNIFRDDLDEAAELAANVITELFHITTSDDRYVALLEALDQAKKAERPSMLKLAELLDNFDEKDELRKAANSLSRLLRLQSQSGMAQLLIGNGDEEAITLDNRLNILQVQNMKMPSPETKKEDYTQEENTSCVLMMVITAFSKRFLHTHPNNFKLILFDESWFIGRTAEGEKFLSYASRMSRSLYAGIILNGHSVTDLPNEGIRNTINYKFCFHTDSTTEAKKMLDFLKLEETEENMNILLNLRNAQCLYQDLNGRVGILTFDAVFQDLIDVFSTTPTDESELPTEPDPAEPQAADEEQAADFFASE